MTRSWKLDEPEDIKIFEKLHGTEAEKIRRFITFAVNDLTLLHSRWGVRSLAGNPATRIAA